MTALSTADVILKNPIGTRLDEFRLRLKSRCDELEISVIEDRESRIGRLADVSGANDLALELLLALQATPLARILPSRRGRGTLMGDISYLVTQIDVSEFDLRSFIPLFVHVDSHASDQKICEALFTIL